jgi:hypothetical protein
MITCLWFAVSVIFITQDAKPASTAGNVLATIQAVKAAYEENRATFHRGMLTFEYLDGFANDASTARKGELRDARRASGKYQFDNGSATYTRIFSQEDLTATTSKDTTTRLTSRLLSVRAATDGSQSLIGFTTATLLPAQPLSDSVRIVPGAGDFYREAVLPLSLQAHDDARSDYPILLQLVASGTHGYTIIEVREDKNPEGASLLKVELQVPNGIGTFWFDLEHGALPRRYQFKGAQGQVIEQYLDDLRQIPGSGWYPFQLTTLLPGGRVQRLEVKSSDFVNRPQPDSFRVEFEREVEIADVARGVTYPRGRVWRLSSLPSTRDRGVARIDQTPTPETPILPGERTSNPLLSWVLSLLALSLAITSLVLWRSKRRK